MDSQNILLFAVLGALCLFIITGGALSMGNTEPSASELGIGAVVGGGIGALGASLMGPTAEVSEAPPKEPTESKESTLDFMGIGWLFSSGSGDDSEPAMKIGFPQF